MNENYYNKEKKEIYKEFTTSEIGLSTTSVNSRIKEYGENKLKEKTKKSKIILFLEEFKNLMIILLIVAAIISFIVSYINGESYIDSIIIIAIVILNALFSLFQESKADESISALKKMQITKVKVKRNNKIMMVSSENLVPGDYILLEAGDTIAADARIIWNLSLKVDEASLTGESIASEKTSDTLKGYMPLAKRDNMVYSGTSVVYGKAHAIVTKTGMNTEMGLIAKSLDFEDKEETPLQIRINQISKMLSITACIVIFIMFIIGLYKGMELIDILMLSISLAVAAVPEGLPAIITIILSIGMGELAKKKAIVRKMSSVETLGSTEIICSDKTGTITENKMVVKEVYYDNEIYVTNKLKKDNYLSLNMALNNDVEVSGKNYIGEATEIALQKFIGFDLKKKYPRISEIPFDSERKMMSTVNDFEDKKILFTKGSFDSLIKRCNKIIINGEVVKLTKEKVKELKEIEDSFSKKAYRTLGFAYKETQTDYTEENLIFTGFVAMIDPPRKDVKKAIVLCKKAGIKPIMITGDSLLTATTIAKDIGILESDEEAITGEEIDKLTDKELINAVLKYSVYARVSPKNKYDIVKAWKENNKIVAMTGDGVNDAPALKLADIGVGMGITGTEVSKSVSDIILTDDSFSSIVDATKEGRRIYDNIRNVLTYLLSCNIAEIIIVFIGMFYGYEIFLPIQLLYINLVTDSVPAISLAFEKSESGIMNRKVRKKDAPFFTEFLISRIFLTAVLKSVAVLSVFFITIQNYSLAYAETSAFLCLILLELIFGYSCKNIKQNILNNKIFNNTVLNKAILGMLILQVILFITPLGSVFDIVSIHFTHVLFIILIVAIVFIISEITKQLFYKKLKD